jgi:hypothetical protein
LFDGSGRLVEALGKRGRGLGVQAGDGVDDVIQIVEGGHGAADVVGAAEGAEPVRPQAFERGVGPVLAGLVDAGLHGGEDWAPGVEQGALAAGAEDLGDAFEQGGTGVGGGFAGVDEVAVGAEGGADVARIGLVGGSVRDLGERLVGRGQRRGLVVEGSSDLQEQQVAGAARAVELRGRGRVQASLAGPGVEVLAGLGKPRPVSAQGEGCVAVELGVVGFEEEHEQRAGRVVGLVDAGQGSQAESDLRAVEAPFPSPPGFRGRVVRRG